MSDKEIIRKLRYEPDTGKLFWKFIEENTSIDKMYNSQYAGKEAGSKMKGRGYIEIWILGRRLLAHRVAWFLYYGVWPEKELDHINHIVYDNRIENLREVCRTINSRNQSLYKTNTSGICGVRFNKSRSKWEATIGIGGGKRKFLGRFKHKEDAINARLSAEKELEYHHNHGK